MQRADVIVIGAGLAGSDHWAAGYMEGAVATGRAAACAVLGGEPIPLYPAR